LALWNIGLSATLWWAFSDIRGAAALGWKAMEELKEQKGKLNQIAKELFDYLGVKLIKWTEKRMVRDDYGGYFGTYCKEIERIALVARGVTPEEVDLVKNPPESKED
jgi:hypothetical protein